MSPAGRTARTLAFFLTGARPHIAAVMPMVTGSQRQPEVSRSLFSFPRARTGCPVRGSPPPRGKKQKTLDSRSLITNGGDRFRGNDREGAGMTERVIQ